MTENDMPNFWKGFCVGVIAFMLIALAFTIRADSARQQGKNEGYNDGRNDMMWQVYNESKEVKDGKER